MLDLHPPSSGLPIASALFWCLAEGVQLVPKFNRHAHVLRPLAVVLAGLSVTITFLTGYTASSNLSDLSGAVEDAVAYHHAWGKLLLVDSLGLVALYFLQRVATHGKGILTVLYYICGVIFVLGAFGVGHLGGELVFEMGVNVKSP
jgi:uncharacterized membrane protein